MEDVLGKDKLAGQERAMGSTWGGRGVRGWEGRRGRVSRGGPGLVSPDKGLKASCAQGATPHRQKRSEWVGVTVAAGTEEQVWLGWRGQAAAWVGGGVG